MTWSIENFMGIPPFLDTAIYLQTSPCKLQKPQRGSAGFSTDQHGCAEVSIIQQLQLKATSHDSARSLLGNRRQNLMCLL